MKTKMENLKKIALMLTLFLAASVWVSAQTKAPVKVAELQKSITDQIAKDYQGYTIKDAFKIDKNNVITYEVNVVKGTEQKCLAYDSTGKFERVIEPKVASTTPKENKGKPEQSHKSTQHTQAKKS